MNIRHVCALILLIYFASAAAESGIPRIHIDEKRMEVVGSAPPDPPSKVILDDACPFEGCGLGTWKTFRDVRIYEEPNEQARKLGYISAGTCVEAKRGEVHTVSPGHFTFGGDAPGGLCGNEEPGSVHPVFAYIGEGYYVSWSDGEWQILVVGYVPKERGDGWEKNVCGTFEPTPTNIWWVFVELDDKTRGWTKEADSFTGTSFLSLDDPDYNKDCSVRRYPNES